MGLRQAFALVALTSARLWTGDAIANASDSGMLPPRGPEAVMTSEYHFKAVQDPLIFPPFEGGEGPIPFTELWASITRPRSASWAGSPVPLVVMLHGNHQTCGRPHQGRRVDDSCEYTDSGTCPKGYVVVPNHLGHNDIAENLASWGMVVVSINANRGINCGGGMPGDEGLNLARGRLILRHLEQLSRWNLALEPTPDYLGYSLKGTLDFKKVGLFGHSRGGEGVRAAYNLYLDPGSPWPQRIADRVRFSGIMEVAAVDGQTHRVLNAPNIHWVQITPACDGDVRLLDGLRPYDRIMDQGHQEAVPSLKSILYVNGANHNFFNSEWHQTEAVGCHVHEPIFEYDANDPEYHYFGTSPRQRGIAAHAASALFLGALKGEPSRFKFFNPSRPLPAAVASLGLIERAFVSTPNARINPVLENFSAESGMGLYGVEQDHSDVDVEHGTDLYLIEQQIRSAIVTWSKRSNTTFFQANWNREGAGRDFRVHQTFSFRVARRPFSVADELADAGIALVDFRGRLSSEIRLAKVARVAEPGGYGLRHPVLHTVKIPIRLFKGVDLSKIRGIRFTFNRSHFATSSSGTLLLDEFRLDSRFWEDSTTPPSASDALEPHALAESSTLPSATAKSARLVRVEPALSAQLSEARVIVRSETPFPVGGSLFILDIDGSPERLSFFPNPNDLREIAFRVPASKVLSVGDALGARKLSIRQQAGDGPFWKIEK